MINPGALIDGLVTKLRAIPALVAEMGNDAAQIRAYVDRYPDSVSVLKAVWDMKAPGALVMYQGYSPGRSRSNETWKHQISIYLKLRALASGQASSTYYAGIYQLVQGIPTGSSRRLVDTEIIADCLPMDVPQCSRRSLVIDDRTTIDYWEFQTAFTEKGDA